jgi:extracellular elastinolytic metalloproteinase
LYEVYWAIVNEHGFEADWYKIRERAEGKKVAGNLRVMQLIVDGMKLQPCRPSFIDARNAILKADEVNFDGEHSCLLWKAFAKRGLGYSARADGREAFDLPESCA